MGFLSGTIYHRCFSSHCCFTWEPFTKRHIQLNISWVKTGFLIIIYFVCVICGRPTLRWLLLSYYFLLSKKFLQYWFIQTSDIQEKAGAKGLEEGTQGQLACQNRPNNCELCAFLILSHSQQRRKLIITFLPVNSEVANMKSNVLQREVKWEVYASVICHCLCCT